ncbi:putative bicoid-interacting protein 3 (Bin3) [Lyophyllum shimeji]|uniref:RNA methyltransferase n=1 Tax=Lyophyllum shimeji TaxID=47721 RepID=A0A9P3PP42_LYOSH|nr:putative bicoid-interacting protein 3 (Bin3) [Lyophyllum shimeji]
MASSSSTVPIYGNYHGYYAKRPSVRDPRLALLPSTIFSGARVLDVGCNEGWVTCEIAQSWGAHKVVGVDIDESLIRAAWRRRRTVWSLQQPAMDEDALRVADTGSRKRRREPSPATPRLQPDYFPLSCEHEFGSLPVPPSDIRGRHVFPHNLSFRTADWVATRIPEDAERYNVVVAFSITKWIHLNGGDEALKAFFQRIFDVLEPGGTFVLEPQAWDTYAKAKRMDERLKENAKTLKIRPDDFESILGLIGFGPAQHFGVTGEGGFRRPVDLCSVEGEAKKDVDLANLLCRSFFIIAFAITFPRQDDMKMTNHPIGFLHTGTFRERATFYSGRRGPHHRVRLARKDATAVI